MIGVISLVVVGGAGLALVIIRKRLERSFGIHNVDDEEDVRGKVVVITGATSGLGKEAARELARRGALLVLACRNIESVQKVIDEIWSETPNCKIEKMKLDLSSMQSIRDFVSSFEKKHHYLNILINNAGVFIPMRKGLKTQEGFEINFGVNYLGHYYLTRLLLDSLKKGAPSRIVNVSSALSTSGVIDLNDLMMENVDSNSIPDMPKHGKGKSPHPYANSKLAQIWFTRHLANQLAGSGVQVYALCPGWVKTELGRYMDLTWWKTMLMIPVAYLFMRTPRQGVQTLLHCTLSKKCGIETGKVYRNCNLWASGLKFNEADERKLWEVSESLVKLKSA